MTATDTPALPNDALWRDDEGRPTYRHRPKLVGQEIAFTIEKDALVWSDTRYSGRLPLHQIESVRIAFRPANLHTGRFRVEIRQRLGKAVWFANIAYRGMLDIDSQNGPFKAFLRELLPRIAKASPKARFIGGEPWWRYVAVGLITAALTGSLAFMAWEAWRTTNGTLGALTGVVFIYTAWLMGQWLTRNRPIEFDPADPPASILPGD